VRLALAILASFVVAALGAAILGEYQFTGITGAVAGLIFGIFVAEAGVAVNREGSDLLAVVCALLTAAALLWAIHASFGARSSLPADVPTMGWLSIGLGVVGAGVRARSSGRKAADTRSGPGHTPESTPVVPERSSPEHPQG
jgi:hypothetical protein